MNITTIIDYFTNYNNISYNYNISDYYNMLVKTITSFNNNSLELFNNINFDNKLLNLTVTFSIIILIQYAYIYYILGELSRLETKILNVTEDMIRDAIDIDDIFSSYEFEVEEDHCDLYFWGIKK